MDTKQTLIEKAYSKYYSALQQDIDENGWLNCGFCVNGVDDIEDFLNETTDFDVMSGDYYSTNDFGEGVMYWRPKALSGIETNNGWVKINSVDDLPKQTDSYHVVYKDGSIIQHHFSVNSDFDRLLFTEEFTHYQPIVKPESPIY